MPSKGSDMTWSSNAEWPKGSVSLPIDPPVSTDFHKTEEQADAVCDALRKHGLGGEGKIFPLRVWSKYRHRNLGLVTVKATVKE